jgi:hypothetical protein
VVTGKLAIQQAQLRAEADAVAVQLELDPLLKPLGEPTIVGSAALGLMTRRDLDITVICATLDNATRVGVAAAGARLASLPRVREVRFRNDTGLWNTDARYPDGLYLGVTYRALDERNWTLDIWFVDEPERQPDLTHIRVLPPRLDAKSRETILEIKDGLARPEGQTQSSYHVYRAVLDHGISTVAAFNAWYVEQS